MLLCMKAALQMSDYTSMFVGLFLHLMNLIPVPCRPLAPLARLDLQIGVPDLVYMGIGI